MRSLGAGYRFFICDECGHKWAEVCRDYETPSISTCPNIRAKHSQMIGEYVGGEAHPEWPTDSYGNLLKNYDYPKYNGDFFERHKLCTNDDQYLDRSCDY